MTEEKNQYIKSLEDRVEMLEQELEEAFKYAPPIHLKDAQINTRFSYIFNRDLMLMENCYYIDFFRDNIQIYRAGVIQDDFSATMLGNQVQEPLKELLKKTLNKAKIFFDAEGYNLNNIAMPVDWEDPDQNEFIRLCQKGISCGSFVKEQKAKKQHEEEYKFLLNKWKMTEKCSWLKIRWRRFKQLIWGT